MITRLFRWLHRRRPARPAPPPPPRMDNPYRRFYTRTPTLEELARRAREREKEKNGQGQP